MDIDALAVLAANTIVTTAVTDAFEAVRTKVAGLYGPVLMGRDFGDITIGHPDHQSGG
jgi:hypothetical protein